MPEKYTDEITLATDLLNNTMRLVELLHENHRGQHFNAIPENFNKATEEVSKVLDVIFQKYGTMHPCTDSKS